MSKKNLKFLVFADFHYRKKAWPATLKQLDTILKRAYDEQVDFVIHAGDFCGDYRTCPEAVRALLQNKYGLPIYGLAGNHELEQDQDPNFVRPLLSNQNDRVFGAGKWDPEDDRCWYYYFDREGYRIVCLDSVYSYSEERGRWERNQRMPRPEGNIKEMSIGPEQRAWLEKVLFDAADQGLTCIVGTHFCQCPTYLSHSPDHLETLEVFKRVNEYRPGTVLMSFNGHHHTDFIDAYENVLYFNINTAINGHWQLEREEHYDDSVLWELTDYDAEGNELETAMIPLNQIRASAHTWFYKDPLSAIVTVTPDNEIIIEGSETEWVAGIEPNHGIKENVEVPYISSCKFRLNKDNTVELEVTPERGELYWQKKKEE